MTKLKPRAKKLSLQKIETFVIFRAHYKNRDNMSKYDYTNAPSLYEIRCENGDFDEEWEEPIVDCGDYYMIGPYKYANSFPKEWAKSYLSGTGPEQCWNCSEHGTKDDVFYGYCLNCAQDSYKGERGVGMSKTLSEKKIERIERIKTQFNELARDLDFVFQIAEGKVAGDDHQALKFFGLDTD